MLLVADGPVYFHALVPGAVVTIVRATFYLEIVDFSLLLKRSMIAD